MVKLIAEFLWELVDVPSRKHTEKKVVRPLLRVFGSPGGREPGHRDPATPDRTIGADGEPARAFQSGPWFVAVSISCSAISLTSSRSKLARKSCLVMGLRLVERDARSLARRPMTRGTSVRMAVPWNCFSSMARELALPTHKHLVLHNVGYLPQHCDAARSLPATQAFRFPARALAPSRAHGVVWPVDRGAAASALPEQKTSSTGGDWPAKSTAVQRLGVDVTLGWRMLCVLPAVGR